MEGDKCWTKTLVWARISLQSCSAVSSSRMHAQLPESSCNISVGERIWVRTFLSGNPVLSGSPPVVLALQTLCHTHLYSGCEHYSYWVQLF